MKIRIGEYFAMFIFVVLLYVTAVISFPVYYYTCGNIKEAWLKSKDVFQ